MRADQVPASHYEPPILIHRADLIDILLRALPRHVLQTDAKFSHVRNEDQRVVVEHEKGQAEATIVVGAGTWITLSQLEATSLRRPHLLALHHRTSRAASVLERPFDWTPPQLRSGVEIHIASCKVWSWIKLQVCGCRTHPDVGSNSSHQP